MIVPSCTEPSEYCFGIHPKDFLFELFVTEAQTTVFFVDFQYLNFDVRTDLSEF